MEKGMLRIMSSLVYDWLVSAGDDNLARMFKEEVPASKGVPAHAVAKPAAQKKKSRLEKNDSIDEEEEAQLGVEIAPEVMLVAAKRRKSNSDDGKIGIPDAKVDESCFEGA